MTSYELLIALEQFSAIFSDSLHLGGAIASLADHWNQVVVVLQRAVGLQVSNSTRTPTR